ncbi:4Fe-4S binding protein [bacterium]|nr:4Fe-4S binding protein [bacterium]
MAYNISDECVGCGTCVDECETGAIKEQDDKYSIIAEKCTECGKCVEVCPVEAIAK